MARPITLHRLEQMRWRDLHFQKQQGRCAACGKAMRGRGPLEPTLDHIVPLSKGGEDSFQNTQALCKTCNAAKADTLE